MAPTAASGRSAESTGGRLGRADLDKAGAGPWAQCRDDSDSQCRRGASSAGRSFFGRASTAIARIESAKPDGIRCGWLFRVDIPICRSADADCVSARSGVGNAGLRVVTAAAAAAEAAADAAAYPPYCGEGVVLTPSCRLAAMPRRWVALCSLITCSCDYERCIFTYSIKQFNVCHCCRNAHACCESLHLVYALVLQVYSFVLPAFIRYRPRVDLK